MTDENEDLTGPLLDPADDAAIAALLAELPAVDMPQDVAARVATALAAEVPLSGAVPAWAAGGATNVSVLPSAKERAARKNARGARVLSAAAAVVLVVGAVAFGSQMFHSDTDGGGSGTAGGAPTTPDSSTAETFDADATFLSNSNTTYTQADIAPKVATLMASAAAPNAPVTQWTDEEKALSSSPPVPEPASSPSPTGSFTATAGSVADLAEKPLNILAVCVAKLGAAPDELPVAVDTGTWKPATGASVPAAVVVLPGVNPARVDVFVVTAGCGDPRVVDDSYLVYFATVARP